MGNREKIILILSIICIIIIALILIIKVKMDNNYSIDEIEVIEEVQNEDETENILKRAKDRSDFYSVKDCVGKFYTYYGDIFSSEESREEGINAVYNILDDKYKDYKAITQNNITEKIEKVNYSQVSINEMYVNEKSENIFVYIVKGKLIEETTKNISDFKIMLLQDVKNMTFTVFLEDYIKEYYPNLNLGKELKIETPENIEVNDYNNYDYQVIDDETYITDLVEKYKQEMLFDKQSAYEHLDEEYRQKRFENFSEFETYAKKNTFKTVTLKLSSYRKKVYDRYTEYVCVDKKGNYYIFKEESVMNYGVILDTYTVELPDFVEKYDASEEEQKVGLNINNVIMAINEADYKYVYNKLNNTYKEKYFKDYNIFTTYLSKVFYASNEMKLQKVEKAGINTYNTTIKITNKDNAEETRDVIIVIKLLEDRNFEMSFVIQ